MARIPARTGRARCPKSFRRRRPGCGWPAGASRAPRRARGDRPCAACWPARSRGRCRSRAGSCSVSSERNGRSALEPGGSASSRACAASRASPTTATSAGCQRPIWPRSESTWISGTLGSEWPKLMVRRLRPAPNTSTQSAWSIMRRAAECEKEPTMPRLAGWPRNMSLPRAEVTSRAPMRSASCSSSALAPARCAPRPATIRGLRLCRTRAAAASIACGRGAAGGRGGFGRQGRGGPGEIHVGELDVDRQQQGCRPALQRRRGGVRQRTAGGFRAGRDEGAKAGGAQHAGGIEALVVRAHRIDGARRRRRITVDDQHARAGAAGIGGGVQAVGGGGSASDHRHAEAAGGIGEALGHGDGIVLVPRAVEADAGTVERRGEDRGVVAHQAEHLLDAERLDVVDEHLIGRRPAFRSAGCICEHGRGGHRILLFRSAEAAGIVAPDQWLVIARPLVRPHPHRGLCGARFASATARLPGRRSRRAI